MAEAGITTPRLSRAASDIRQSVFAALQGRIDVHRAGGGELIPLHIGDTHLAPPVGATMVEGRDLGVYGAASGLSELRAALATFRRAAGLTFASGPEVVHVGCGCTHALFCAARAVLDPGDEVIVMSPYWPLFPGVLQAAGAVPRELAVSQRLGEAGFDLEAALEAARGPSSRAVYFVSPNNPDGHVMDAASLEIIAAFARRHELWVFADEVYADFVYEGRHRSIAELPQMARRTITSFSLSKSHGLAGARIGYVIAPPEVIAATRRMSNHTVYNVPVSMQRVALAAVTNGASWISAAHARYRAARDATAAALDRLGLRYQMPRGGSFFFLDLRPVLGARELQALLEPAIDAGVLLAPGEAFGAGFERHARLCFTAVPEEQVLEGVRRLGRALEALS